MIKALIVLIFIGLLWSFSVCTLSGRESRREEEMEIKNDKS